jgi:UDP-N-acetyl-2-amino-2-deoxyglucuronate dehydrogenase
MSQARKRWGAAVIGCGGIGHTHARVFCESDRARLVAVSSRQEEKARRVAEAEGCSWSVDPAELLRRADVDLVSIATSSGSHASLALAALAAGKHVVVEKPLAMTAAEGREVIDEAHRRGLTLSVIAQRRFEPGFQAVKRAVAAGALGRLLLAEASCPYFRPQSYYDSAAWRGTVADDGGALMNQGIHLVDLLLWIAGPARRVSGLIATQDHVMEAEDLALGIVSLENGAFATLLASTNLRPGFPHALSFYGDKGSIRTEGGAITHWGVPDLPAPPVAAADQPSAGAASPGAAFWSLEQHRAQLEDVLDAIETGRNPAVPGEDGLRAVELVEAIYRSSKANTLVL